MRTGSEIAPRVNVQRKPTRYDLMTPQERIDTAWRLLIEWALQQPAAQAYLNEQTELEPQTVAAA